MRAKISKWIYANVGFIAMVSMLGVTYIFFTHKAEKKLRTIEKLKKEVSEAKHYYHQVKSDMMYKTTESQLEEDLRTEDLKSNDDIPLVLRES